MKKLFVRKKGEVKSFYKGKLHFGPQNSNIYSRDRKAFRFFEEENQEKRELISSQGRSHNSCKKIKKGKGK